MNAAFGKYLAALLLFGSNGVVASMILLSSYDIVLLRTCIGSLLLLILFFITGQRLAFFKNKRSALFLAASGACMGASWMFLYEAYQQIGVSLSSLLYYCGPVLVMIVSPFLFQEKLTVRKVSGFLIVLLGLVLVNGQAAVQGTAPFGLFCGAMSAVLYAVMLILNKKVTGISGRENSMMQLLFSFLAVAAFVGVSRGFSFTLTASDWFWILVLGLINTGIGCYLYFSSIGSLPVQTISIFGYLEPLSAVLFSVIFLAEVLTFPQAVGACCIIGGAIYGGTAVSLKLFKRSA